MSKDPTTTRPVNRVGLVQATTLVFAATAISAVLGLLREVLIASEFGSSKLTDAYFFAYDLVLGVPHFLLGGMAAALIAIYASIKRQQTANSGAFASTVINVYLLGLLAACVVVALLAPIVAPLLASGFAPSDRALVVKLTWCLTPTILLFGVAMILKSLLEAEQMFFVSQVSTAFLAISIVATILLFAQSWGIYCLPLGMLIGTTTQAIWTGYWLKRTGFEYRFTAQLRMPEFHRFLSVLWPGIFGGLIVSVIPLIDKSMASHLDEGAVACLSFASRPISLVTRFGLYSLITALLPTLAWKAAAEDSERFSATVSQMLRLLIFVTTPLGILLAALRVPIIELLFERGNFDSTATAQTSSIFAALACGLCPMAVAVAMSTVFKSMEDTKTAAFVGGGSNLITKVIFNVLLIVPLGAIGLALSTSLQYVASAAVLLFCLARRLHGVEIRQLASTMLKVAVASAISFLVVNWIVAGSQLAPLVLCTTGMLVGTLTYIAIAALLRTRELSTIYLHFVDSRFVRRYLPFRVERILP